MKLLFLSALLTFSSCGGFQEEQSTTKDEVLLINPNTNYILRATGGSPAFVTLGICTTEELRKFEQGKNNACGEIAQNSIKIEFERYLMEFSKAFNLGLDRSELANIEAKYKAELEALDLKIAVPRQELVNAENKHKSEIGSRDNNSYLYNNLLNAPRTEEYTEAVAHLKYLEDKLANNPNIDISQREELARLIDIQKKLIQKLDETRYNRLAELTANITYWDAERLKTEKIISELKIKISKIATEITNTVWEKQKAITDFHEKWEKYTKPLNSGRTQFYSLLNSVEMKKFVDNLFLKGPDVSKTLIATQTSTYIKNFDNIDLGQVNGEVESAQLEFNFNCKAVPDYYRFEVTFWAPLFFTKKYFMECKTFGLNKVVIDYDKVYGKKLNPQWSISFEMNSHYKWDLYDNFVLKVVKKK